MPLLAPNRRALATRFPEALRLLDGAAPARRISIPAEAPSFVEEAASLRRLLLVLTGLPAQPTTSALLSRAPRDTIFWCVEPKVAVLAARLAAEDLSTWISDPRVFLSIGVPSTAEVRRLNRELAWVDRARALFLPSRYLGQEAHWQPLLVETLARVQQRWQNVLTDLRLTPARWENTCANLRSFLDAPPIERLTGAFAGTTLVLVAAGPSLDDALPFLHRVAPHALIVTGNTSFRALAARGLQPHLTVTVDPFSATDLGYAGQPLGHTHLVSPVFAYPGVHRRFAGRLFGMWDQSQLLARLRHAGGLAPAPALLGDATVSTTVLNLASHLGCSKVVFVGQDFAVAADGRTHASDTFYTDLGCNRQDDEKVHRLRGNTIEEVLVPSRHLWYLRTVESMIARSPAIEYRNTSHRGAVIAGAPYLPYEEVAAELAAAPRRDFAAEIGALHSSAGLPAAARSAMGAELERARLALAESFRLSLTAALANEIALADPAPASRGRFEASAQQFEHWRNNHPTEQRLLFEGRTKPEIFGAERRRVAFPTDLPDQALREAGEVAWAFAEGAASVHQALLSLAPGQP